MSNLTLSRQEIRDVDRRAIEEFGIPGVVLMENAGRGITDSLCRQGCTGPVVICAGKGNNGGDGFVIARHLAIRGIKTQVLLFCLPEQLQGDAAINYLILQRSGLAGSIVPALLYAEWLAKELAGAEWIVDALLGTGTQGFIREPYLTAIDTINQSGKPVLAVDLPSGMDCDTGESLGACIRARHTATLVAAKPGFATDSGREFTGTVEVVEIGVPPLLIQELRDAIKI
ncbi:MAG: nnr 2 [Planctomycetaceae bacterium]|nr:nnr 2 [Planctomycetaceae bacterium]